MVFCLPYEMIPKENIEDKQMKSSTSRITKEETRDFFLLTNDFTLQQAACMGNYIIIWE